MAPTSSSIDFTTIRGLLNLRLRNGQNEMNITNNAVVDQFHYRGGSGVDRVTLDNARVTTDIEIELGTGADRMTIVNIDPAAIFLPVTGSIDLDGGNPGQEIARYRLQSAVG